MRSYKKYFSVLAAVFLLGSVEAISEEKSVQEYSSSSVEDIVIPISNDGETTTLGSIWDKTRSEIKEIVNYEILNETDESLVYIGFGNDSYSLWAYNFNQDDQLIKYNSLLNETLENDEDHLEMFFEETEKTTDLLGKATSKEMVFIKDGVDEDLYEETADLWPEGIRKNEFFVENVWDREKAKVTLLVMSDDPRYINELLLDADYIVSYSVDIK